MSAWSANEQDWPDGRHCLYATSDVPLIGERALARRARVPVETAPMMDRESGMTQVPDDGRAGWCV